MLKTFTGSKEISDRITEIILKYRNQHEGHRFYLRIKEVNNSVYKRFTCSDCTKGEDLVFLLKKTKGKPLP